MTGPTTAQSQDTTPGSRAAAPLAQAQGLIAKGQFSQARALLQRCGDVGAPAVQNLLAVASVLEGQPAPRKVAEAPR